jgi:hypothetical protein
MAQPLRKQPLLQRILAIIGTGLERAGRALRRQGGEPVSKTPPADPDGPPLHWLELLSKSQVPLVWMRRKADDLLSYPQEGWQPRVPFQGSQPADANDTATSQHRAVIDNVSSLEPTFPAFFPTTTEPELPKKIEWPQEPQGINKTRQPERNGPEDRTLKRWPPISIIPRPTIASNPQSVPHHTGRSAFRLVSTAKFSQPDQGQGTKQIASSLPRYVRPQRQSQVELHWPGGSPAVSAIAPRYETSQRSGSQDVSFLEVSTEPKANKNLFPEESLSVDRWPSLPPDWLARESEASVSWPEQAHRQRLEQEQRGE